MLKVKKKIPNIKDKNKNEDVSQLHEEIKNSIKNLYISDQKKAKTIKEYAEILSKIRNEYALLQKEHNQTKTELQKYQHYVQNLPQKPRMNYQKRIRKIKHYYDDQVESKESDSYVTEIRRTRPNKHRKKIIYEDEIVGLPDYELHSPTEDEEQEEEYDNKVQTKSKKGPLPLKQFEKPKQLKKGIIKSIKMFFFVFFISCNLILSLNRQDAESYIKQNRIERYS